MTADFKTFEDFNDETIKTALEIAEKFGFCRLKSETDDKFAKRVCRILTKFPEIPRFFEDGTWDVSSVIDTILMGLSGVVASNYPGDDLDLPISSSLYKMIGVYRKSLSTEDIPPSNEDILSFMDQFNIALIEGRDKVKEGQNIMRAFRSLKAFSEVLDCTKLEFIEALILTLADVFSSSPVSKDLIEKLLARIYDDIDKLRKDKDSQ